MSYPLVKLLTNGVHPRCECIEHINQAGRDPKKCQRTFADALRKCAWRIAPGTRKAMGFRNLSELLRAIVRTDVCMIGSLPDEGAKCVTCCVTVTDNTVVIAS